MPISLPPIDVTAAPYFARADGKTDCTEAVNRALSEAARSHRAVFAPSGVFVHSGVLIVSGVTLSGDGAATVFSASDPANGAVELTGEGAKLKNCVLISPNADKRLSSSESAAVWVNDAKKFLIQSVQIGQGKTIGAASGGILCADKSSEGGQIRENSVTNTLADGIHLTAGASKIDVRGNTIDHVGDDMIAVVSYLKDGKKVHDVTIAGNHCVSQTNGRGISVVGGENVTIERNVLESSNAAGIYLASEDSYQTYGPSKIFVTNNILRHCNQNHDVTHGGIFVFGRVAQIDGKTKEFPAETIVISGNTLTDTFYMGIRLGAHVKNLQIKNNILDGVTYEGIAVSDTWEKAAGVGATNITIVGNRLTRTGGTPIKIFPGASQPIVVKDNHTGSEKAQIMPPKPYGPIPTPRQLRWQALEAYAFVHFTVNTFTDKEWGYGDESPELFNPTNFDASQIVKTVKEAGLTGLVLTCKHHDGFCLWPSAYTNHSVKNSPWKNGKGDMVREFADACKKYNVKFGVYLSPWDRNRSEYGKPEYLTYYRNQLRELLTNYGPLFEVWFDGANGGDGYYGGARETRKIDNTTYYDWPNTWKIVRELQPDACMFSDAGPDVRWVGNEDGFAGNPCWATINPDGLHPGGADPKLLNTGQRNGTHWLPAEADVSIRPGWFYHESEDESVKTVAKLLEIYDKSIGRGTNLILNIPPDKRGQIPEKDAQTLRQWRKTLIETFAENLANGATATAENTRGNDTNYSPSNVADSKSETYWSTDDTIKTASLTLDLHKPTTFSVIRLREYLPLGQHVNAFAVDAWHDGKWEEITAGTSIGAQRLAQISPVTTEKVRLRITSAEACPAISEFSLFAAPK